MEPPVSEKIIVLHNGVKMPAIGLGTFRIKGGTEVSDAIDAALAAGYRMFDTAAVYRNEQHINEAFKKLLPKYNLDRDNIFITTKLAPSEYGTIESVIAAYEKSIKNLGLDRVDLYLIHFPGSSKVRADDPRNARLRERAWAALVKLYDEGRVSAIGVSNYTERHLKELLLNSHGVVPMVNQVEWHPFYYQQELLEFCNSKEIVLQAYSSLGGSSVQNYSLIEHPVVIKVAQKHQVSPTQVLLRWALQREISIIPKSTNPEHIRENISLDFVLSNEEMKSLDNLKDTNNVKYAWNPIDVY